MDKALYARRKINCVFHTIFKELKEQDSDGLKSYVRMEVDHFEQLVHLLSPLDKRKNVSENLLKVWKHVVFLMFSHLQHEIFVVETKNSSNQFAFFFVSATKDFKKKVTKQINLTWGHVETFIGDCNIVRFLLPSHKNCLCVPLDLDFTPCHPNCKLHLVFSVKYMVYVMVSVHAMVNCIIPFVLVTLKRPWWS